MPASRSPNRFFLAVLTAVWLSALSAAGCNTPEPESSEPQMLEVPLTALTFTVEEVALPAELRFPLRALRLGSHWIFAGRTGQVWAVPDAGGAEQAMQIGDLEPLLTYAEPEQGLLGIASAQNNFGDLTGLYVNYTRALTEADDREGIVAETVLAYIPMADGQLDLGAVSELLVIAQPFANHNGGFIEFGPDGYLYMAVGDGGSAGDPLGHGQKPATLLGTILRLEVSPDGYRIPADNPFADRTAHADKRPEIFAWGLRNPWQFHFDRDTGDLWAGDVGQNLWEEIDVIESGQNYGWALREGPRCHPPTSCDEAEHSGEFVDPVTYYHHDDGLSISSGPVYRGGTIPALNGHVLYGDFVRGTLWAFPIQENDNEATSLQIYDGLTQLVAMAEDEHGEVYVLTLDGFFGKLTAE